MVKRVLVFASGSATGGGSGFRNLVEKSRGKLPFEVVAVVTHHYEGGVVKHARNLGVDYCVEPVPVGPEAYQSLVQHFNADLVALSGWLKPVAGLPTEKVINIHPGPLPEFGGKGMHGHHVHEAVIKAYREGTVKESAVSMHFVTPYEKTLSGDNYDKGPRFASVPVPIDDMDDADNLGSRVNKMEHMVQPALTALVAEGRIRLLYEKVTWEKSAWFYGREFPY